MEEEEFRVRGLGPEQVDENVFVCTGAPQARSLGCIANLSAAVLEAFRPLNNE